MTEVLWKAAPGSPASRYADCPNRSPWLAQLGPDEPPRPLRSDRTVDVVVVGAGIAGIATAFFVLRSTGSSVMLVERDRVARGATGHNAGQLTTYFERPLSDIADEFGWRLAADAHRHIDEVRELLEVDGDFYRAVLSEPAGCSNSSALCRQVLGYLQWKYADRFVYADRTNVERLIVDEDRVVVHAGPNRVTSGHVVLCTNGF